MNEVVNRWISFIDGVNNTSELNDFLINTTNFILKNITLLSS